MAARFVVGLALFALCHSSPVLNGDIRDGRYLSLAQSGSSGGADNSASAKVTGHQAEANGYSKGAGFARDGLYQGQGQTFAKAQNYDSENAAAIELARAQGIYRPLPVAQPAVITYNQNIVPAEQLVYQPLYVAPATAESVATNNGASESSLSTVSNNGAGSAESNSQTSGQYGYTTTNAKTLNGYNSAVSNANTGLGVASVSSKASGSGLNQGFASSNAQANGFGSLNEEIDPSIIAAKNQGFYTPAKSQGFYTPARFGAASSNANVNGYGSAESSAKTAPARRSIHWHFGTAYDIPAGYGTIKSVAPVAYQAAPVLTQAAPVVYQAAPVVYQAAEPVEVSPYGNIQSSAVINGNAAAQSNAQQDAGSDGYAKSTVNSNHGGRGNANADINNNNGLYRSGAIGSNLHTKVNTIGHGAADSFANWNHAKTVANSHGGSSTANADINRYNAGLYRTTADGAQRIISGVQTNGVGNAESDAQQFPSGFNRVKSVASTNGLGSANSYSKIH
ncbi:Mucin related 89F [Operophtera brumata]|uniref:Mucin related 89F n=1 Tax=Operophtera brumata TaxID=104452 RepID=A0A0L7LKD1_OPEBR|nr:Mucin related 89F [Operophtera brumata]